MTSKFGYHMPSAADLFGDLEPPSKTSWRGYAPGLLVASLVTLAAAYLSDHYGAPITLIALLLGLSMNFLSADKRLVPGLDLASKTLLRIGIVLVGTQVTLGQVVDLGPIAVGGILLVVGTTLVSGIIFARWLGLGGAFGTLAGGAVAICGASAALALATVLGERRIGRTELTLVLVGISAMSSLAMVLYPIAAHVMGFDDVIAGFLIGASIHDVAQALGSGFSFSQQAGETAAIVKLSRVALLAPVLALVSLWFAKEDGQPRRLVAMPWFVIGFFALAAINSAGLVPAEVGHAAKNAAAALLACAVAATGMRSRMDGLIGNGARPFIVIVGSTAVAFVIAAVFALILQHG